MFWDRFYIMCSQQGCKPNTVTKAIGLSGAIATKWKNGSIPNGEILMKIADYLNCSVDYLLGRTENPSSQLLSVPFDPLKSQLDQNYSALNQDGKKALVALSDDMVAGGRYRTDNPDSHKS